MCHKSNFYLRTELLPSIPHPFQQRTFFIKCKGRLDKFFGLLSSLFYVFTTPLRLLSSFQLLVNNELFHQSSFYLKILFHQSSFYLRKVIYIFLREDKVLGEMSWGKMS